MNPFDRVAVVQPRVITAALRAAAREAGLFYPPDPGSVEMCTVGGNAATNAGGMCCVKYGVNGIVIGVFGHAGDGNLHPTLIFDNADPRSRAAARAPLMG